MTHPAKDAAAARITTPEGGVLAVHELGGDGRPLVMVHATSLHGLVCQPVADHLRESFRCVAPDLRGHGDSSAPAGWDFTWRGFAQDVLAVVDALELHRPLAMGHSSGGTALLLAEEARPGTFAGIYCYEPVVVAADPPLGRDPDSWMAAQARRRREVFGSRDEARRIYAGKPPFSAFAPEALDAYVEHGFCAEPGRGVRLKCRSQDEAFVAEMATAHDCFSRLGAVSCPVTLARGSDCNGPAGEALLEVLADAIPEARVEVLRGLSHYGPLEDPGAVAASIRRAFS